MVKQISKVSILLCVLVTACGDDDDGTVDARLGPDSPLGGTDGPPEVTDVDVTEDIDVDTTWTNDKVYHLKPKSGDVTNIIVNPGATLTIEAGTHIVGAAASSLVIAKGAKINAVGTAAEPIVFSQDAPVGQRYGLGLGQWGGIVILGKAPYNLGPNTKFEAFPDAVTDERFLFGGADTEDDSGTLKYVRIEFGGFAYKEGREFNGLTLCGVGSATDIDFIQLHRGSDDGIEFFGGTVNVKHVVSSQNEDDGFDTDNGWNGDAQFIIVQHINGRSSDPRGYESDNCAACADAMQNPQPQTSPTAYNVTIVGNDFAPTTHGAFFRRDTGGHYFNHIIQGFNTSAILVDDSKTCTNIPAELSVQNSIFFGNAAGGVNWETMDADCVEADKFAPAAEATNREVDPELGDPTNATAPDFKPANGSPALEGAAPPPDNGFFDTSATFVGAIGDDDWTVGWTSYPQN